MHIVLLGATGFVGHHLLPRLYEAGHSCRVLTRNRMACRELSVVPGVDLQQTDVNDPARLAEYFQGADAAVNMVGILNERGRSGKGFHEAHVACTARVIDACRAAGVPRLLQLSALNAGQGKSHYLESKGQAEQLVRAADDLEATIFQPSVIFGDGDSFFNRFAALLRIAPLLPLACPDARLQPVWVGDVTTAMVRSLDDRSTFGRTLPLVGPRAYTLRELVEFTAQTAGLGGRRVIGLPDFMARLQARLMDFVPGKPFSTDNYLSLQTDNVSEANALPSLGIVPTSIEAIVPEYLDGSPRQHRLDGFRRGIQH